MVKVDMFSGETKWFCFVVICMMSCTPNLDNQRHLSDQYHKYKAYQEEEFGSYETIYCQLVDSLFTWKNQRLAMSGEYLYSDHWGVDSIIVFNSKRDIMYAHLIRSRPNWKSVKSDMISPIGGKLIDGKWYFFFLGIHQIVMRGGYQDDAYSPLTFEELSYIVHTEMLGNFVQYRDGNWVADEAFFYEEFQKPIELRCKDAKDLEACGDSLILHIVSSKYQHKISKEEIEKIQAEMAASVRPTGPPSWPPPRKPSILDRFRSPPRVKIFESEAWKNRHNEKQEQ